jgi:hypothetical protein
LKNLITENIVSLSPENFHNLALKENAETLEVQLILKHNKDFIKSIDQYSLNGRVVAIVIMDQNFHSTEKEMIVSTLSPDDISEANANDLINAVLRQNLLPRQELFEKLLISATSKSLAISLLVSSESSLNIDLIPKYLQSIGEPYSNLLSLEETQLEVNENHQKLLQFLKKNGLITDFKKGKASYIVSSLPSVADPSS